MTDRFCRRGSRKTFKVRMLKAPGSGREPYFNNKSTFQKSLACFCQGKMKIQKEDVGGKEYYINEKDES